MSSRLCTYPSTLFWHIMSNLSKPKAPSSSSVSGASGSSSSVATVVTKTTPYLTSTGMPYTGTASVAHSQSPYPSTSACTGNACTENVNNVVYCSNQNESQSCGSDCTGTCTTPPAADSKSGTMWRPEVHNVTDDPNWHYSVGAYLQRSYFYIMIDYFKQRSTHYGITSAGACGFGLYGLCTSSSEAWVGTMLGDSCTAFCTAYPTLCQDPASGPTLRGNFAAPTGDYYTQVSPNL